MAKWIAYFSDASGEYELTSRSKRHGEVKKITSAIRPHFFTRNLVARFEEIAYTERAPETSGLDIENARR